MVRPQRPHRSKLGLIAGMLLLGVAIALVLAAAVLVGLRILTALNALLMVWLPGIVLGLASAGIVWLARANRLAEPPPAQVRWDELLRPLAPRPRVPGSVTPADMDETQVLPVIPAEPHPAAGPPGRSPWTR